MMTFLLIFNIVLAVVLLVGVVFMLRTTLELRKAIKLMDARVGRLDERVTAQQQQVNELRQMLSDQPDPIQTIIKNLSGFRKNGPVKTLVALGTSLFAAYFKQKRVKALPSRVESKD